MSAPWSAPSVCVLLLSLLIMLSAPVKKMILVEAVFAEFCIIVGAFLVLICILFGYFIYLSYMSKDEANKDRLLNVLYANLSYCFILNSGFLDAGASLGLSF